MYHIWREEHTAMRSLGGPEDGRLARLADIGSLSLSGEQQWVRVSIGSVVDDPAQVAQNAEGEDSRVDVPALKQRRDAAVQLIEKAWHGEVCERGIVVV